MFHQTCKTRKFTVQYNDIHVFHLSENSTNPNSSDHQAIQISEGLLCVLWDHQAIQISEGLLYVLWDHQAIQISEVYCMY